MGHRRDLNSLSAGSRMTLRGLMLSYINDAVVWAITVDEVPMLHRECKAILLARSGSGGAG